MNKGIRMGLPSGRTCRLFSVILLILAGKLGTASGQTLTNLYTFDGSDGASPLGGLVQGSDGNFYGTTYFGGGSTNCFAGCGTVFRISQSGTFTSLHSFSYDDGEGPSAALVLGSDGNFYGTTTYGGTPCGCGTVFRINPSGDLTNLHSFSFSGSPSDGVNPYGGLVQGSDGNFYGTTSGGRTNRDGTVFRLSVPLNPPANQISAAQTSGNDIYLSIPSVAGETYRLQFTTDPASGIWSNVPGVSITNSIGALMTLTNFGGAVGLQGFYRFAITP